MPSPKPRHNHTSSTSKHVTPKSARPRLSPKHGSIFKKGGGGKKRVKSKRTPSVTLVSSRQKSAIDSRLSKSSRFLKIVRTIQKVSYGIKSRLFSLVTGCVKMVMNKFKVDYAFFDVSHERYNIIQKNIVTAIICMSQHGALKINDDLFDAFSYALFWGLRQHDHGYFSEYCRYAISDAEPGSESCIKRTYALANADERFPCIRTIVKRGRYNANHVEKNIFIPSSKRC